MLRSGAVVRRSPLLAALEKELAEARHLMLSLEGGAGEAGEGGPDGPAILYPADIAAVRRFLVELARGKSVEEFALASPAEARQCEAILARFPASVIWGMEA